MTLENQFKPKSGVVMKLLSDEGGLKTSIRGRSKNRNLENLRVAGG